MNASWIAAVVSTAPIGTTPLVSPLAQVIMSGITPYRSAANGVPDRPNPVITSSKISRIPCLVQISRSRSRYPFGGTSTPVDPATGSTITAAIVEASCSATIRSSSSASSAPCSGCPLRERILRRQMRVRQVVDPGQQRPEELAVRDDPADRNPAEVHAVIAALAPDQPGPRPLALRPLIGEAIFSAVSTPPTRSW